MKFLDALRGSITAPCFWQLGTAALTFTMGQRGGLGAAAMLRHPNWETLVAGDGWVQRAGEGPGITTLVPKSPSPEPSLGAPAGSYLGVKWDSGRCIFASVSWVCSASSASR